MIESVREIVVQLVLEVGPSKSLINDSDSIYHDLGIAGDDADELLEKIHARFATSFEGLDFHTYFPDELDAFCYHLGSLFGIKDKRKKLTFGHLVRVVQAGHWFEELVK